MQRRLMQHRRTKWVWIDGFLSGVWKWECFRTVKMSAGREFQVDGAATEKARRASSVCMRGTTSIGASEERRARGGACVCATWVCTTLCISKKFIMSIFVPPPYQTGTRKNNVLNEFARLLPNLWSRQSENEWIDWCQWFTGHRHESIFRVISSKVNLIKVTRDRT